MEPERSVGRERNNELQAYVRDAFEVRNGVLRIRAEKRRAWYGGKLREYTSGMMTTYRKFSQKHGRCEISCRVPKGTGLWPAFWLLPEPLGWPPEIDVFEILGQEPNKIYFTHHWNDDQKQKRSAGGTWEGPDLSREFHVIAAEWSPEGIVWFVDGVERSRSRGPEPAQPMYLLVNLAIGGWPGPPDNSTPFPCYLEVDYVRVYRRTQ